MNIYTLYLKIHKITGLRYLGQTKHDPFKYSGSGVDWLLHLEQYGNEVDTEVLFETASKDERNYWGRYYSKLWNIVNAVDDFGNKIYANRIPETGGGGIHFKMNPEIVKKRADNQRGTKKPIEHKLKCKERMLAEHSNPNSIYKSSVIAKKKSDSMKKHRGDKTSQSKFNKPEYLAKLKKSCLDGAKKIQCTIISPTGEKYDVVGISTFCKLHNLNKGAMCAVIRGDTVHHKGWTGHKVTS